MFEQESYQIDSIDTENNIFTLDGNQTTIFMEGDLIRAVSLTKTTSFEVSSVNYSNSKTHIKVKSDILSGVNYQTIETEGKGTRDGQILWSLLSGLDDVKYEWNAYVTFDHELNIIGG